MQKVDSSREIDKALEHIMSEELAHHTCQLFEREEPNKMKPYGSGVLAILNENYYILTASHVVEDWSDEHQLFIRHRKGYISVVGTMSQTIIENQEKVDLAFIRLKPETIKFLLDGYKFLPISKFRRHRNLLDAAQYCVIGFPEVNQRKDEKGILHTGTSAYFMAPSKPKVYDYYKLKPENHISLEFKGQGKDVVTGDIKKLSGNHYGLSGCGLWLIILNQNGKGYDYDFRLIGIMTDFRRGKYDCLFGNHIEQMLMALREFKLLDYKEVPINGYS